MLKRISKLIGAVVGLVVAYAFMKIPVIANLGFTPDQVAGQITTLIVSAIAVYFAPANSA